MNTEKVLTLFTNYFVDSFRSIAPELSSCSLNTINEILVAEMWTRYNNLQEKRIRYPEQFTEKDTLDLDELKAFIREEKERRTRKLRR